MARNHTLLSQKTIVEKIEIKDSPMRLVKKMVKINIKITQVIWATKMIKSKENQKIEVSSQKIFKKVNSNYMRINEYQIQNKLKLI